MDEVKIKSDNQISIGYNIKRIRQAKGIKVCDLITQMQLSGLNVNKQRFYKLEHDLANVYASELVAMAEFLEVDVSEFFNGGGAG